MNFGFISDEILNSVEKPARYTGGEWNSVVKKPEEVDIRFAFCFPDVYEVGMSHLGMKILYHLLNERKDTYCERVFAPWVDLEEKMRENNIPLFALESQEPITDFDFIGFTLQYEMSYSNIINMLDLANVPILASQRDERHPIVCVGGPCAYNMEPIADFVDFVMLGEGEEIINEVMDVYAKNKAEKASKLHFLEEIATIEGIYVPQFYDVQYNEDGTVSAINHIKEKYPSKLKKRIIKDMDNVYFPDRIVVPFTAIVHDRIMLEIFRGCSRGCRFCQAGVIYRPVREKTPKRLLELAEKLVENTGYDEISLTSLSTSDYSGIKELTNGLIDSMESRKVNLSLPSLRIDSFSLDLMEKAQKVRKGGLTFAPEAGSQRLRDVINKGVSEEDLIHSCSIAFNGGWSSVKLYFMLGLPTENFDDIQGIADLGNKVIDIYMKVPKENRGKGLNINISTSSFVPKPFTPFQWEPQDSMDSLRQKPRFLKDKLKNRFITYHWSDPETSFLEAVFARGDRRLGKVIAKAVEKGCKFDGWGEHFRFDVWMEAFKECNIPPEFYANRERSRDEVMPWDHIDVGVTKAFLYSEREKAYKGEVTPNCMVKCAGCGATVFEGGICFE